MNLLVVSTPLVVNNLAGTSTRRDSKSQGMTIADRIRRVLEVRDWKRGAKAMLTGQCACVYLAADYVGWYGHQQTFDFASPHYANDFAELNRSKLQSLDNRYAFRDPAGSSLLSNALIVCVLAIVIFASVCLLWSQIVRDAPSPPPVTAGRGVGHDATVTAPIPQPTAPVRPARHRHDASVHRPR